MKRAVKVMVLVFTLMLAMSNMSFAMWIGTVSQSDFQNYVKSAKFAIFVKRGSTITMYEASSPSSAAGEFRRGCSSRYAHARRAGEVRCGAGIEQGKYLPCRR